MPARCGPLARGSAWCSCPPLRHTDLGGSPSYLCPYPRAFVAARSEAAHRSKAVTKATARRFCEEELDSLNGSGHTRAVTQGSAPNKKLETLSSLFPPASNHAGRRPASAVSLPVRPTLAARRPEATDTNTDALQAPRPRCQSARPTRSGPSAPKLVTPSCPPAPPAADASFLAAFAALNLSKNLACLFGSTATESSLPAATNSPAPTLGGATQSSHAALPRAATLELRKASPSWCSVLRRDDRLSDMSHDARARRHRVLFCMIAAHDMHVLHTCNGQAQETRQRPCQYSRTDSARE